VTADGHFIKASEAENADLFWALRGGGGNFGIVTNFQFRLHSVGPLIFAGMVVHPMARAKQVLQFYREFSAGLPDGACSWAALLHTPDGMAVVGLLLFYGGSVEEGSRILEPARRFGQPLADLVQPMPYVAYQSILDGAFAVHGLQRYWKSGYDDRLDDACIDAIVRGGESLVSPLSAIALFLIHGTATRVPPGATAFGARKKQWDINVISQWSDRADSRRQIDWTRELWSNIEPHTTGAAMINHLNTEDVPERIRASYGGNYEKLATIKKKYDPTNFFRLNANIQPAIQHVRAASSSGIVSSS
ncbi:MAG TPA: BBE domain-containing protein, partial [Terriglobales bacterium]|nr:BBE domain-containing protein [Terriglobales bacterium]